MSKRPAMPLWLKVLAWMWLCALFLTTLLLRWGGIKTANALFWVFLCAIVLLGGRLLLPVLNRYDNGAKFEGQEEDFYSEEAIESTSPETPEAPETPRRIPVLPGDTPVQPSDPEDEFDVQGAIERTSPGTLPVPEVPQTFMERAWDYLKQMSSLQRTLFYAAGMAITWLLFVSGLVPDAAVATFLVCFLLLAIILRVVNSRLWDGYN